MDMLTSTINSYQKKILTAAEVIEELIKLSKSIKDSDNLVKALNLSPYEYAFYSAVASNNSAQELMQKDKLRELAIVLTEVIRSNVSLDWTVKESARVKMRVAVKRLLNRYGYPPDMSLLTTEAVLAQAELLSAELATED